MGQEQGLGALLDRGVHHLDALEYLAHDWRPGWIGKAVLDGPLGQSGQALLERIGSEPTGMVGQIVGDAVRCRRQVAAPFDLEVAHRGLVAAPGVLAGGGITVAVECRHARSVLSTWCFDATRTGSEERRVGEACFSTVKSRS